MIGLGLHNYYAGIMPGTCNAKALAKIVLLKSIQLGTTTTWVLGTPTFPIFGILPAFQEYGFGYSQHFLVME